jgi:hypothetical protein
MRAVEIHLRPDRAGELEIRVTYSDAAAAGAAEVVIRDIIAAAGRTRPQGLAWLGSLRLEGLAASAPNPTVVLTTPLPAELIAALKSVGGLSGEGREADADGRGSSGDAGSTARPDASGPL